MPNTTKVFLTFGFAILFHFYLLETSLRQQLSGVPREAGDFWLSGIVGALPYLRTDNQVLKFLTFFVTSYLVIWLFSKLIKLTERLQIGLVKHLRRVR